MAYEPYSQNPPTRQMPPQHSQGYQQYQRAPQQPSFMPSNDFTTTGNWVLTLFLMCIPVVNIILLFVWAFGSNTPTSKQNWARANLIWILIAILASILIGVIATAMGISIPDIMSHNYGYSR